METSFCDEEYGFQIGWVKKRPFKILQNNGQ